MTTPSSPYVKTFLFPWEVKKEDGKGGVEIEVDEVQVEEEELDEDDGLDEISCLSDGTAKPHRELPTSLINIENHDINDNEDMDLIEEEEEEDYDDDEYDEAEEDKGIDILESELEIAMASRDEEALLSLLEITNHLIASSPPKKKRTPKKERSTTPSSCEHESPQTKLTFDNFHKENTRSPTYLSLSKKFESILNHSYNISDTRELNINTCAIHNETDKVDESVSSEGMKERLNFTAVADDTIKDTEVDKDFDQGDDYYCDLSSEFDANSVAYLLHGKENEDSEGCPARRGGEEEGEEQDACSAVTASSSLTQEAKIEAANKKEETFQSDVVDEECEDVPLSTMPIEVMFPIEVDGQLQEGAILLNPTNNDNETSSDNGKETSETSTVNRVTEQDKENFLGNEEEAAVGPNTSSCLDVKTEYMVTPIRRKKKPPPRSSLRKMKAMSSDSTTNSMNIPLSTSIKTATATSLSADTPSCQTLCVESKTPATTPQETPLNKQIDATDQEANNSPDCVAAFDDVDQEDVTPKKYHDLDSWINDMMKHSKPTPNKAKSKNLYDEMNKERRGFFISKEDVTKQAKTMIPLIMKKHEENEKKIEEAARRMVPLILKEQQEIQKRERNRKIRERFGRKAVRLANEFYSDLNEDDQSISSTVYTPQKIETI